MPRSKGIAKNRKRRRMNHSRSFHRSGTRQALHGRNAVPSSTNCPDSTVNLSSENRLHTASGHDTDDNSSVKNVDGNEIGFTNQYERFDVSTNTVSTSRKIVQETDVVFTYNMIEASDDPSFEVNKAIRKDNDCDAQSVDKLFDGSSNSQIISDSVRNFEENCPVAETILPSNTNPNVFSSGKSRNECLSLSTSDDNQMKDIFNGGPYLKGNFQETNESINSVTHTQYNTLTPDNHSFICHDQCSDIVITNNNTANDAAFNHYRKLNMVNNENSEPVVDSSPGNSNKFPNNSNNLFCSQQSRRHLVRKLKKFIQTLGNINQQAVILSDVLKSSDMQTVVDLAGIANSKECQFSKMAVKQLWKQVERSSKKDSVRGRVNNDLQSYRTNALALLMPSPTNNSEEALKNLDIFHMLCQNTSIPKRTARRLVLTAKKQRDTLTKYEKDTTWSIIKHRNGYNTQQSKINSSLFEWIINHPHVRSSPMILFWSKFLMLMVS